MDRRQFLSPPKVLSPVSPDGYWLHVHRPAMACRFEITLPAEDYRGVDVARHALEHIDQLEDQLTVFRDTSEISFINRTAALRPVTIESELLDLLLLAQRLYRETDGAFDITSGPLTHAWRFFKRQGCLPETSEHAVACERVGMHQVHLDVTSRTIQFARPGVELNLGSIGKGYALDAVATMMRRRRTKAALLSGGSSSVLALGPAAANEGWLVGLRHPHRRDMRWGTVRLRDCALATSGSGEQFFEVDGKRYGHIIDPRTGWPAEGIASVTVIAPTAAEADALATAFYVGGPELAERYCRQHREVLALILTDHDFDNPIIIGASTRCRLELAYD
ncbi:MAG: FAD:protein FMN transferase [Acidobacteriota bacterium]|nr:FAD:protein FMN transferase [Acidobacteriota bacterium]